MAKNIPPHLREKTRKCIFCGEPGTSRTHIWPDWLNQLILDNPQHIEYGEDEIDQNPLAERSVRDFRQKQGAVFSAKPYLACETCNTGWMREFEDEMVKFAKPIFTGGSISLTHYQRRVFIGWLTLITILAEYTDKKRTDNLPISKAQRDYFKKYLEPPENWTIVVSSLDAPQWVQKYRLHTLAIHVNQTGYTTLLPFDVPTLGKNTQVSSFGLGKLFVQVFSCPVERTAYDFRAAAKARGFTQLWPYPSGFWPFSKRLPKFPTKIVLNNEEADDIADAFFERLKIIVRSLGRI